MLNAELVLDFWLGPLAGRSQVPSQSRMWFAGDAGIDENIRENFLPAWKQAVQGELNGWTSTTRGKLALTIILDQFSRHLFRGRREAFAQDSVSLPLARELVTSSAYRELLWLERCFVFLPFTHAEDRHQQAECVRLNREILTEVPWSLQAYFAGNLRYAERHQEIIDRFGRFPHRNIILGRTSTAAEIEFLKEPMSSF